MRDMLEQVAAAGEFFIEGDDLVRAVGVSHYQPALLEIAGAAPGAEVRVPRRAALVPQPDNPHDRNAVAVEVGGRLVGYLARDDAAVWQPIVGVVAEHGALAVCEAMIAGRGAASGTPNLGVFLRLPTPTEARAQVGIGFEGR
jgi:hypothetical protein